MPLTMTQKQLNRSHNVKEKHQRPLKVVTVPNNNNDNSLLPIDQHHAHPRYVLQHNHQTIVTSRLHLAPIKSLTNQQKESLDLLSPKWSSTTSSLMLDDKSLGLFKRFVHILRQREGMYWIDIIFILQSFSASMFMQDCICITLYTNK